MFIFSTNSCHSDSYLLIRYHEDYHLLTVVHFASSGPRRMGGGGTATGTAQQLYRSPSFSSGRSSGVALDVEDIHSDASMEEDVQDLMHQVPTAPTVA